MTKSDVWNAPLPTFFKLQLLEASRGRTREGLRFSYYALGHHLGSHHVGTFELDEHVIAAVRCREKATPSATLRRVLANDAHPDAPMLRYIPPPRRRAFLEGLLDGAAGERRP